MTLHGSLTELLSAARRRVFGHVVIHELLLAAAVGLAVAAVVLLAGTAQLGTLWIPLAALGTFAVRMFRVSRKRPSPYAIAQNIDQRLKLADTLSTAAYFAEASPPGRPVDPALRDLQRLRAEDTARSVDLKKALPMRRPFSLYPAAILALVVVGVLLLRVTATGSFDTRASLVGAPLKSLLQSAEKQTRAEKKPGEGDEPASGDETSKQFDKNRDYAGEPEAQAEESPETPETAQEQKGDQKKGDGKGEAAKDDATAAQKAANQQDASQEAKEQEGQQQQESLLDKLKDAVSDMLGKSKPSGKQQKTAQKGKKGDKQQSDDPENSADTEDKNPGDNADSENHNKGSEMDASGMSAEGQKDDNQHSGVGSQDGDKAARDAEALKAMGKISELFGKRAENVTGEVMIEVGTTRQQLKTPLAQRTAAHNEAGSEIHRDQVPLEYEQFVQRYFDQVRGTPPSPPKPASSAAPSSTTH